MMTKLAHSLCRTTNLMLASVAVALVGAVAFTASPVFAAKKNAPTAAKQQNGQQKRKQQSKNKQQNRQQKKTKQLTVQLNGVAIGLWQKSSVTFNLAQRAQVTVHVSGPGVKQKSVFNKSLGAGNQTVALAGIMPGKYRVVVKATFVKSANHKLNVKIVRNAVKVKPATNPSANQNMAVQQATKEIAEQLRAAQQANAGAAAQAAATQAAMQAANAQLANAANDARAATAARQAAERALANAEAQVRQASADTAAATVARRAAEAARDDAQRARDEANRARDEANRARDEANRVLAAAKKEQQLAEQARVAAQQTKKPQTYAEMIAQRQVAGLKLPVGRVNNNGFNYAATVAEKTQDQLGPLSPAAANSPNTVASATDSVPAVTEPTPAIESAPAVVAPVTGAAAASKPTYQPHPALKSAFKPASRGSETKGSRVSFQDPRPTQPFQSQVLDSDAVFQILQVAEKELDELKNAADQRAATPSSSTNTSQSSSTGTTTDSEYATDSSNASQESVDVSSSDSGSDVGGASNSSASKALLPKPVRNQQLYRRGLEVPAATAVASTTGASVGLPATGPAGSERRDVRNASVSSGSSDGLEAAAMLAKAIRDGQRNTTWSATRSSQSFGQSTESSSSSASSNAFGSNAF